MENTDTRNVATPVGAWKVRATAQHVVAVEYLGEAQAATVIAAAAPSGAHAILDQAEQEITQYFAGQRTEFTVPHTLAIAEPALLTPFQRDVLAAVAAIPFGETATYGEIAAAIGHPRAVRAVGGACGANPVPLLVPCHRVVAAHGLGGYRYGQEVKRALLQREGHQELYDGNTAR